MKPKMSHKVACYFVKTGKLFDTESTEEQRKLYPSTVGYITSSQGYSQVYEEDVKGFEKYKKYCAKNGLCLKDELWKFYKKETKPVSFYSNKGKKLLRDSPFFIE